MQICDYRTQSQLSLDKLTQIQCFIQLVYVNTIRTVCMLLSSFISYYAIGRWQYDNAFNTQATWCCISEPFYQHVHTYVRKDCLYRANNQQTL